MANKQRTKKTEARSSPKDTGRGVKDTGRGLKGTGMVPKATGSGAKATADTRNGAGASSNPAAAGATDAGITSEELDVSKVNTARISNIALVAPERTGRSVEDLPHVLLESEVRLKLAWKYRELLDPALPQKPPFHTHAWSALRALQKSSKRSVVEAPDVDELVQALLDELVSLRRVVELTTRPGDAARTALQFATVLRATHALVDIAPKVIEGARAQQARFPALTDTAIERAGRALAAARKAITLSDQQALDSRVSRLDGADDRQLALDALLDAIDHLRAAALTTLRHSRPLLAGALSAPVERQRSRSTPPPEGDPEPEPDQPVV